MLKTFQRLGYFVRLADVPEPIAVPDVKRKHFATEANTLDAARMAALEPAKRATLLAALLAVRTAQARDDVAEMFIKRMSSIHHKAKEALAAYHAAHQGQTDDLIATLRDMVRAYQHTGTTDERIAAIGNALTATPETILAACEAHLADAGNNYFPRVIAGVEDKQHADVLRRGVPCDESLDLLDRDLVGVLGGLDPLDIEGGGRRESGADPRGMLWCSWGHRIKKDFVYNFPVLYGRPYCLLQPG